MLLEAGQAKMTIHEWDHMSVASLSIEKEKIGRRKRHGPNAHGSSLQASTPTE